MAGRRGGATNDGGVGGGQCFDVHLRVFGCRRTLKTTAADHTHSISEGEVCGWTGCMSNIVFPFSSDKRTTQESKMTTRTDVTVTCLEF